jgi:hypothetical protein
MGSSGVSTAASPAIYLLQGGAMRLIEAVTGPPRSGKTTYATSNWFAVIHTDDYLRLPVSEQATMLAGILEAQRARGEGTILCIEGTLVPRMLRKWLDFHAGEPTLKPLERLIVLKSGHFPTTERQDALWKGVASIIEQITPQLRQRGVEVIDVSTWPQS